MSQPSVPLTRGDKPLRPTDVEYLFRAVKTDLSTILNRLKSIDRHYDTGQINGLSAELAGAILRTTEASGNVLRAEKLALKKSMPHRQHAGEHEDW